jgi:hypothetical protein
MHRWIDWRSRFWSNRENDGLLIPQGLIHSHLIDFIYPGVALVMIELERRRMSPNSS